MADVVVNAKLVAACGLYCGACGKYEKGACPGCAENRKAGWCKVRSCCAERSYGSCAQCKEHADPRTCAKFHNPIARVIGVVLNSDRKACLDRIRDLGPERYAAFMAERRLCTLPRRGPQP